MKQHSQCWTVGVRVLGVCVCWVCACVGCVCVLGVCVCWVCVSCECVLGGCVYSILFILSVVFSSLFTAKLHRRRPAVLS